MMQRSTKKKKKAVRQSRNENPATKKRKSSGLNLVDNVAPDVLRIIAYVYLDLLSFAKLVITSKQSYELLDPVWKEYILLQFPYFQLEALDKKTPTYFQLYKKIEQATYPEYTAQREKEIFMLVYSGQPELIPERKITLTCDDFDKKDSFGETLISILQKKKLKAFLENTNETFIYAPSHNTFDQLHEIANWSSLDKPNRAKVIELGVKLNLCSGKFKKLFEERLLDILDLGLCPLELAAAHNALDAAIMLLELKVPVINDACPLYMAAQEGHFEMVKLLVDSGQDVSQTAGEGYTPLYIAAQRGHIDIINYLHTHGADIDARCRNGSTPLYIAAQEGKIDVIIYLLSHGANAARNFRTGFTPLYVAARNGHARCVEILLQAEGVNIEAADHEGSTPLYVACQNGHLETCKKILAAGASPEADFLGGYTPLYIASQNGYYKIVEALCQNKIKPRINDRVPNGSTALYIAAQNALILVVEELCKAGANLNCVYSEGYTPLYVASQKGFLPIVKTLLQYGANLDCRTSKGASPLYVAAQKGNIGIVKFLLRQGADVNSTFHNGFTPLHIAVLGDHLSCVKLLVQYGASLVAKDLKGCTPLDLANSKSVAGYLSSEIDRIKKANNQSQSSTNSDQQEIIFNDMVSKITKVCRLYRERYESAKKLLTSIKDVTSQSSGFSQKIIDVQKMTVELCFNLYRTHSNSSNLLFSTNLFANELKKVIRSEFKIEFPDEINESTPFPIIPFGEKERQVAKKPHGGTQRAL